MTYEVEHFLRGKLIKDHVTIGDFGIIAHSIGLTVQDAQNIFSKVYLGFHGRVNLISLEGIIGIAYSPTDIQGQNSFYIVFFAYQNIIKDRGHIYPEYHCVIIPPQILEENQGNLENIFEHIGKWERDYIGVTFSKRTMLDHYLLYQPFPYSIEKCVECLNRGKQNLPVFSRPAAVLELLDALLMGKSLAIFNAPPDIHIRLKFVQYLMLHLPSNYRHSLTFATEVFDGEECSVMIKFLHTGEYVRHGVNDLTLEWTEPLSEKSLQHPYTKLFLQKCYTLEANLFFKEMEAQQEILNLLNDLEMISTWQEQLYILGIFYALTELSVDTQKINLVDILKRILSSETRFQDDSILELYINSLIKGKNSVKYKGEILVNLIRTEILSTHTNDLDILIKWLYRFKAIDTDIVVIFLNWMLDLAQKHDYFLKMLQKLTFSNTLTLTNNEISSAVNIFIFSDRYIDAVTLIYSTNRSRKKFEDLNNEIIMKFIEKFNSYPVDDDSRKELFNFISCLARIKCKNYPQVKKLLLNYEVLLETYDERKISEVLLLAIGEKLVDIQSLPFKDPYTVFQKYLKVRSGNQSEQQKRLVKFTEIFINFIIKKYKKSPPKLVEELYTYVDLLEKAPKKFYSDLRDTITKQFETYIKEDMNLDNRQKNDREILNAIINAHTPVLELLQPEYILLQNDLKQIQKDLKRNSSYLHKVYKRMKNLFSHF